MSILLIIFLIFYLILAFRKIDWALMLIIFSLPLYVVRFDIFVPTTLLEMMILVCFGVWFIANITRIKANILESNKLEWKEWFAKKNRRYPFDIEIVLMLIISFIAVGVAGFSNSAFGVWKAYFFEPILVFILILNVFKDNSNAATSTRIQQIEKILLPLTFSALLISIVAIYQKITGNFLPVEWANSNPLRVTSVFSYPNAVGLFLAPLVIVFLGWMLNNMTNNQDTITKQISNFKSQISNKNSKSKLSIFFIGVVIILSLLAIIFARSRGALAGILVGAIVFALLAGRKVRLAAIITLVIICTGVLSYAPLRENMIEKVTLSDLSGEIRKQQWRETWQMMSDSPTRFIFGAGLANYQSIIKPYHQEGIFFNKENDPDFKRKIVIFDDKYRVEHWQPVEIYLYPHNIFLNFWTELGLTGLLLFFWIIGKYFIYGIRNYESGIMNKNNCLLLGLICSMVAIVVHGLVDVPYFKNDLAVLFWVFVAMMSLMKMQNANIKN